MNEDRFIRCESEDDRKKLIQMGFVEIQSSDGATYFLNNPQKFAFFEGMHSVHTTNIIAI